MIKKIAIQISIITITIIIGGLLFEKWLNWVVENDNICDRFLSTEEMLNVSREKN